MKGNISRPGGRNLPASKLDDEVVDFGSKRSTPCKRQARITGLLNPVSFAEILNRFNELFLRCTADPVVSDKVFFVPQMIAN